MKKLDLNKVKQFIEAQGPDTKIYLGCDSERIRIDNAWHADYVLAIVVHINGNNGCKLFGEVHRERVYDQKESKPAMRLMTEVYKVSELYLKLAEVLEGRNVEVHLDINPDEMHGSSCVISQALVMSCRLSNLMHLRLVMLPIDSKVYVPHNTTKDNRALYRL
jgi:predicted RNase H-related nuclease YkuK (DUF458 family)